ERAWQGGGPCPRQSRDRAQLQFGAVRHTQAVRSVGHPAGLAVGDQPAHGQGTDEADRRVDGPRDLVAHRRDRREGAARGARAVRPLSGAGDRALMKPAALAGLVCVLAAVPARAEVIELVDKTKINAKIVHYYDGVYSVETGGQTM